MLDRIIKAALSNRTLVLVLAAMLMAAGLYVTDSMELDVFPDLNAPTVTVMTEAEGMAPEEVERLVTFPIETALNGATDVRRVRSNSASGFSIVYIEFDWGTDIYRARQIVAERLAMLSDELPEGAGQPTLGPQSSILGEVMIIGLTSPDLTMSELRTIADWTIRPRLLATGGVAQVAVTGGDIREYQILLDPRKMSHYGVSLDEVLAASSGISVNAAGGTLYDHGNEYILRGLLSSSDTGLMEQAVIRKSGSGRPVLLSDVADVKIGAKTPKLGCASNDGKPAVMLTVTKQPDVNTMKLTEEIDSALEEMKASLPEGIEINNKIFRQSNFVASAVGNVGRSLLEGAFFVALVLFIFLMNWRTTVISLLTIPVSLLTAVLCMKFMGFTLNTMSLGGLAIAIGSLVDDSIVDVENVFRRLRQNSLLPPDRRNGVIRTVYEASREVRLPMLNSTLIIVVCFMPLFFLSGMEGRMLKPLGITFITALFTSTFTALTLTPVLCSMILGWDGGRVQKESPIVIWLKKVYSGALDLTLGHKAWVLGATGAVLALSVALFFSLGSSFLPAFNEGSFTISISSLPGISLDESDKIGRQAEELLGQIPQILTVGRKTGRAELDEHSFGVNTSELECPYTLDRGMSKAELTEIVRNKLSVLPGVNIEIGSPVSHRIDAMLSGTKSNIAVKLFGTDLNSMYRIGNRIRELMEEIPGLKDINVEQQVERPILDIVPDRTMMARYGVTLPEFSEAVSVMMGGKVISQVYEDGMTFDLTVKADPSVRDDLSSLGDMPLCSADGKMIPLYEIAGLRSTSGPDAIGRENVSRKLVISCNAAGGELGKAVAAIREAVNENIELPQGYHIEYGGQFESAQKASKTIAIVTVFAVIFIFLLLLGEFRNGIQTLTVLLNLPLALIGGVIAIKLSSGVLSIPAIIGFISLFGIATRNGMLLVEQYNTLVRSGMSLIEAVRKGSAERLNPILMTAVTSALALLPLALGGELPGNEIQSPMAIVILGGLVSSTLLNGFIVPIMYVLTNRSPEGKDRTGGNS